LLLRPFSRFWLPFIYHHNLKRALGTKKDWILFKQFSLRSKGSGQIQYQALSAIAHLILFEPEPARQMKILNSFFDRLRKFFTTWMPVRRTHTLVQSILLQSLAVDHVQDTCGVVASMGKTHENSQRNSALRRLKSIQNVAPIPPLLLIRVPLMKAGPEKRIFRMVLIRGRPFSG
jgi:hypothetical protein